MCDFYLSTIFFHIGISTLIGIIIGLVYYLFTKNKSNSISLGIKVSIIVVSAYPIFILSDNSITGDSSIYILAIYFSLFPLLFLSSKNRKYKISICVLVPTALLLLYLTSDGYARYYNDQLHAKNELKQLIEQHHDEFGIKWPLNVAPYHAVVVPINYKDETMKAGAEKIYQELLNAGVEVVLDDRDAKPGFKFKDWDLIGIPMIITVGRRANEGIVEFKFRQENVKSEKEVNEVIEIVTEKVRKEA
mgnify:CR=1 FL=1